MSGLFGSTILEVAIGITFIYFLLSTICSAVQEVLAGLLKLRARDLEQGIKNMLCDADLAQRVLAHPLIKSMGSDKTETPIVRRFAVKNPQQGDFAGKPSYIPANTFVSALFDSLAPATDGPLTVTRISSAAAQLALYPDNAEKQSIGTALLSLIAENQGPAQLAEQVGRVKQIVATLTPSTDPQEAAARTAIAQAQTIEEIRTAIMQIGPGSPLQPFAEGVLRAIDAVQSDLGNLRKTVEGWYNNVMDRVSGVYKRRVQWWLLIISLLITCSIGADTLRIVNTLATSATLRSVLVEDARQTASTAGQATPDVNQIRSDLSPLDELFGYNGRPDQGPASRADASWQDWLGWGVWKVIGLLLTVLAVSLGAPFWFDVMSKVANIRAAGDPPKGTSAGK